MGLADARRMSTTLGSSCTLVLALAAAMGGVSAVGCTSRDVEPRYAVVTPRAAEQLNVTEIQLARVDPTFRKSVSDYAMHARQMKNLEGASAIAGAQASLQSLADAIEAIPNAPTIDLSLAAQRIRGPQPPPAAGFVDEVGRTEANQRSLQAASSALGAVAGGPYRHDEEVRKKVKKFQDAVQEFSAAGEFEVRRERLTDAIEEGRGAMEAILSAAARSAR
jgi:hypothetical protein